jgi:hypothetical protein
VLCQRVIVVARISKSQQNVTGCIDHGEQHATWSTWTAPGALPVLPLGVYWQLQDAPD